MNESCRKSQNFLPFDTGIDSPGCVVVAHFDPGKGVVVEVEAGRRGDEGRGDRDLVDDALCHPTLHPQLTQPHLGPWRPRILLRSTHLVAAFGAFAVPDGAGDAADDAEESDEGDEDGQLRRGQPREREGHRSSLQRGVDGEVLDVGGDGGIGGVNGR